LERIGGIMSSVRKNQHRLGPHNSLRFSGGPNGPAITHQNATTGASRKMKAKPRLAPAFTEPEALAVRCKRELNETAPGAVAQRSGSVDVD